jgi:hypothetical protein
LLFDAALKKEMFVVDLGVSNIQREDKEND